MDSTLNKITDKRSFDPDVKPRILTEIDRKYNTETPLHYLTRSEIKFLKRLDPLHGYDAYSVTVKVLYWKIVEKDLNEDIERLSADPEYDVKRVRRLRRFEYDECVPEHIKTKAMELLKKDNDVIKGLPSKYTLENSVHDLTEEERNVLEILSIVQHDYHPVVEFLHWEVTDDILSKEIEMYKAGHLTINEPIIRKLNFLSTHDKVPDKIKQKCEDLQRKMSERCLEKKYRM